MEEVTGPSWSIFISVCITLLGMLLAIGAMAVTNRATLTSELKHTNDKFIEVKIEAEKKATEFKIEAEKIRAENKLDIEKIRADNKLDIEKMRTDHKIELDKLRENKGSDTMFLTESLSKFNAVLTDFKVNMEAFKFTMSHVDKTVSDLNIKMEKQAEKISFLERDKK